MFDKKKKLTPSDAAYWDQVQFTKSVTPTQTPTKNTNSDLVFYTVEKSGNGYRVVTICGDKISYGEYQSRWTALDEISLKLLELTV